MSHNRAARRAGSAVLAVAFALLTGCGGGGGGGNGGGTTPPPSGGNPQTPTSRLTLTGTVTDGPIANAVVTATVGSQTFTTNADANGNYSLEISIAQSATGGFVTLSAKGVGSQSYVEFTSLLGTFSSLLTQAGSDATLTNTENFATQITNVSTALAVLLREANGGLSIASETLIQTLSARVDGQDVLDLATAIKLLVDAAGDYPMPNGQTSMSALLANTAAREAFVEAAYVLDQEMFATIQNGIVSDATVFRPVMPTSLPSSLLASTLPTNLAYTYTGQDRAVAYTFNNDGSGTAATSSWYRNITWHAAAAGSIEITYQTPIDMWGYERGTCAGEPGFGYGVQDLLVFYTINQATLRQLTDRILAVTETRNVTYRDCNRPTGTAEPVTVARTLIDASNTQTVTPTELRDTTRTLWVYDAASDFGDDTFTVKVMPDIADLHADGTGSTRVFNKEFTWALDASGKVMTATFTDGTVAKYRSLREVEDVATDVLYDLALPTGQRNVGSGVSIYADPQRPLVFTPDNVVGRQYWLGFGEVGAPPEFGGFRFRYNLDGTGSRENELIDALGNIELLDSSDQPGWGLFWRIEAGDLIDERTREVPLSGTFNCFPIGPSCQVWEERRRRPLASDGARSYSLDMFRSGLDNLGNLQFRQTYIGMYDLVPFDGSSPNSKPVIAGKQIAHDAIRGIEAARLKKWELAAR